MTVRRVILGYRSGAAGLWISKPGRSADSGSLDDFLFDSQSPYNQPLAKGTITSIPLGASAGTDTSLGGGAFAPYYFPVLTIAHNLGYVPPVFVQIGTVTTYAKAYVDASNFYVFYEFFSSPGYMPIIYNSDGSVHSTDANYNASLGAVNLPSPFVSYVIWRNGAS